MRLKYLCFFVVAFMMLVLESHASTAIDSFPIPKTGPKQLFYLQRTTNSNTIICDLNTDASGQVNKDNPVHVYWIRYDEGSEKKRIKLYSTNLCLRDKARATSKRSF